MRGYRFLNLPSLLLLMLVVFSEVSAAEPPCVVLLLEQNKKAESRNRRDVVAEQISRLISILPKTTMVGLVLYGRYPRVIASVAPVSSGKESVLEGLKDRDALVPPSSRVKLQKAVEMGMISLSAFPQCADADKHLVIVAPEFHHRSLKTDYFSRLGDVRVGYYYTGTMQDLPTNSQVSFSSVPLGEGLAREIARQLGLKGGSKATPVLSRVAPSMPPRLPSKPVSFDRCPGTWKTLTNATVYSRSSFTSPLRAELPPGTLLDVRWCDADWLRVLSLQNTVGYLPRSQAIPVP